MSYFWIYSEAVFRCDEMSIRIISNCFRRLFYKSFQFFVVFISISGKYKFIQYFTVFHYHTRDIYSAIKVQLEFLKNCRPDNYKWSNLNIATFCFNVILMEMFGGCSKLDAVLVLRVAYINNAHLCLSDKWPRAAFSFKSTRRRVGDFGLFISASSSLVRDDDDAEHLKLIIKSPRGTLFASTLKREKLLDAKHARRREFTVRVLRNPLSLPRGTRTRRIN